jgi:hypothetical protein
MAEVRMKMETERDPFVVAREHVTALLLAMEEWGNEEDGITLEVWDAYEAARKWLGFPVKMSESDSGEHYQCLSSAMRGDPWPEPEGGVGW